MFRSSIEINGNRTGRFYGGVIVIGLILAVLAGILLVKDSKTEYAETTAVVRRVYEEQGTDFDDTVYHVYVDYTVNGVKYKGVELNGASSSMKVGDELNVLYDVNDPENVRSESILPVYIIGGVGAAAFVFGVVMTVRKRAKGADGVPED